MKSKHSKKAGFFVLLMLGAATGYFVGKMGYAVAKDALSPTTIIVLALLFPPIFLIVVGFHEGGHAIAGILVKFDFRMYVIGPFMWEREEVGWKFKWNKNVNTAGGMVICMPTGTQNLKNRFSIYAAGGPLASLLLAVLAYSLLQLFNNILSSPNTAAQILLYSILLIAMLSAIIFVATAIPMHNAGFYSDGARIIRLQRGGEIARFDILMLKIIATSTGGTRPAQFVEADLEEARELAEKLNAPFGVYIHSYFHQASFDRGDYTNAEKHLEEYLRNADSIPDGIRNVVWLDAAFFFAFAKRDLQQAEMYWQMFKPSAIIPKAQVLATEAAIAWLKNNEEVARLKTQAAMAELPGMIDKGVALALKEKLLQIRSTPAQG